MRAVLRCGIATRNRPLARPTFRNELLGNAVERALQDRDNSRNAFLRLDANVRNACRCGVAR
eukprot:9315988-Lingulodinium_polyedra.AAC.1